MPSNRINKILAVIFASLLTICLRALHLSVVQRDAKIHEAQKPQSRTLIKKADRGTISDRFGIPLALNRISYNAAIYYSQISQIPSIQWKENAEGKRTPVYPRKEYIRSLAKVLGETLGVDENRVEDLIHSKASLFPHAPFIVKSRLSEEEHYRLKGLERDWPGVHAETSSERFYPLQKTACHILGTIGAISQKKYAEIAEEMGVLQEVADAYELGGPLTLPKGCESFEEVADRLRELKEKAYTLNDSIGKSGIEGQFEEALRGFFGKKTFEIDQKGRFVRELAGSKAPVPGRRAVLSISAELQQIAEELLAISEKQREGRSLGVDPADKKQKALKQPWIKGGAIAAIDPNNGEVLALASFPRFDPNDFAAKSEKLSRWLENDNYIGAIWDGAAPLVREQFTGRRFVEDEIFLTWDHYLEAILSKDGPLRAFFHKYDDLKSAIQIQEDFEAVCYFSKISEPIKVMEELPKMTKGNSRAQRLEGALSTILAPSDKLFAVDLCRVCVEAARFSDELIVKTGSMKLSDYRNLCGALLKIENETKKLEFAKFRKQEFLAWRESHQKEFLAEKRKKEKENKSYAHPYLDYLDQKEREMFAESWSERRLSILFEKIGEDPKLHHAVKDLSPELAMEFLRTFRSFSDLDRPLLGTYRQLHMEKDLAGAFYPKGGFGYLRSHAFQTSAPLGSLFKVVTSYEGLRQGHCPFIIDDHSKGQIVAYSLNGTPYPRMYKGGRLPRSAIAQIGKIDVAGALEQTSNPYFSILAGDYIADPEDLATAARSFGFGEKSGILLPGEATGLIPSDLRKNKTSLYSFAFGQHTLLSTPLQTSIMLSALANGGKILKPKIAKTLTGLSPDRKTLSAFDAEHGFAREELQALGIPFSLFTGVESKTPITGAGSFPTEVRRIVPLPSTLHSQIFEGMDRSMWSAKGSARPSVIRTLNTNKSLLSNYLSLSHQIIGKTGTAEILYQANANPSSAAQMVKYIWFGAISFSPEYPIKVRFDHPELIVVVFLRFGDAGKEAAPIAAQMVKKWREIKKRHENDLSSK